MFTFKYAFKPASDLTILQTDIIMVQEKTGISHTCRQSYCKVNRSDMIDRPLSASYFLSENQHMTLAI